MIQSNLVTKRNLAQLRAALRHFRGRVALGRDATLVDLDFQFFFRDDGEESEETEISQNCFDGDPDSGHPMPGTYTVRVLNGEGKTVLEESGIWQERRERLGEPKAGDSMATTAQKLVAVAHQQLDKEMTRGARLDENVDRLTARLKEAEENIAAEISAKTALKNEILQFQRERDEAFFLRDEALMSEAAIQEEFEAYKQRGAELRPIAENMVSKILTQGSKMFFGDDRAELLDAFEESKAEVIYLLMKDRLSELISFVHAGVITWDHLRYLIFKYYEIDPGPEIVDPDWQPPSPAQEPSVEAEPPAEETH